MTQIHWTDRLWLATMSIANGMPFAIIFLLAVMFKRFGLNNSTITFNISFALLPWVTIRPLCHLLLNRIGWTKDVWLLATELVIAVSLFLVSETVTSDLWFQYSIVLLLIMTSAAAVHCLVAESLYRDITSNSYPPALRPMCVAYHCVSLLFGLGVLAMVAGNMEVLTRNPRMAWTTAIRVAAMAYTTLWLFHLLKVWCNSNNSNRFCHNDIANIASWKEFLGALQLFFGKRSVSIGALFFMFFLLQQGLTSIVTSLFVIDSVHRGGLGLSPQEYGLTIGTVGIIGLAVGHLSGIRLLKHYQFSKVVVPLSVAALVPAIAGFTLSRIASPSLTAVNTWLFLSHSAIGLTLALFMSFLAYYSCGKYRPTFYSIGLGLLFLSLFATSLYSGSMQRYYGYHTYFFIAVWASLVTPATAVVLKHFCFREQ